MSNETDRQELAERITGRTITGLRVGDDGFDLLLDDGSEVEIYVFDECWGWCVEEGQQEEKPAPQKGEVYRHREKGYKRVVLGPKSAAELSGPEWEKVADEPHDDGDFSYACGSNWCQCSM